VKIAEASGQHAKGPKFAQIGVAVNPAALPYFSLANSLMGNAVRLLLTGRKG
jgi:hypothetical protein